MADTQNINAVTDLQSIDGNDSILVSDSNTSLGKINYNKLAKAIIESYTGSSLAGQSVSIQQAFSTLNSKLGKLKLYRSTTGSGSSTVQTFNVSDLTSDDYPIFLFTVGFSTTYISAMIYLNRGTESNIAYEIISTLGRSITSVTYDVPNKKIEITLDNPVYRSGALLRLQ